MNGKSDVAIIGGGAIGLCSAYYLARSGCRVTVLERDEIGQACSEKNAGLVAPSHIIPLAAPGVIGQGLKWLLDPESPFYIRPRFSLDLISWLWKFRAACSEKRMQAAMPVLNEILQASYALFDELSADARTRFEFTKRGLLLLYLSEKTLEHGRAEAELAREFELPVQVLDTSGLKKLEPDCPISAAGGVYFSQDGHFEPTEFLDALRRALTGLDVQFHTHTEVTDFEKRGRKISGIVTNNGVFTSEAVVLAGGSWSPRVARSLGIRLPVQAGKGYSITLDAPKPAPSIPSILTEARLAVTPLGNRLRFAGTMELAGLDLSLNPRRIGAMLEAVPQYYPETAANAGAEKDLWAGLRPCSPDGLPLIGRAPNVSNFFIATGHAMLGMMLSPVTGKLVSELVTGQPTCVDARPLSPARFD